MSYADVRHHYEERDDDYEPEDIVIVEMQCPVCKKPVQCPESADVEEQTCSMECRGAIDLWYQEQYRNPGNFDCYASVTNYCDQLECLFRSSCLSEKH